MIAQPAKTTAERSPLAKLIKAQPRRMHEFPVEGIFALGTEVKRVAIRVATKKEQNAALDAAMAHIAKRAERAPLLASDATIVEDAKSEYIVAACCFDPSTPDMLQMWPTGEMVHEDLTADQIGVMVRLINEVRAKFGPTPDVIDDDRVEAFATMAAVGAPSDIPEEILTPLPHPYLVQLFVLVSVKLREVRAELAALRAPAVERVTEPEATDEESPAP